MIASFKIAFKMLSILLYGQKVSMSKSTYIEIFKKRFVSYLRSLERMFEIDL